MDLTYIKLQKVRMCCFCAPLSKGFLAWGYANLVYHGLLLALVMFLGLFAMLMFGMGGVIAPLEVILLLPVVVLFINIYSLLFVIAAHLKKIKLLRNLFIAGTVLWIFEVLYSLCLGSRIIILNSKEQYSSPQLTLLLIPVILEPFLQGYGLLLIHSMMLNLREEDHSVGYNNLNRDEVESGDGSQSFNSANFLIK